MAIPIEEVRRDNLVLLIDIAGGGSQRALADRIKRAPSQVSQWVNRSPDSSTGAPRSISGKMARTIEQLLGLANGWMDTPHELAQARDGYNAHSATPARYSVEEAREDYGAAMPIELTSARGSCGGGIIDHETVSRTPLLKEASWFRRYRIRPEDAIAVWADGESMADFIVDGDIVIFDRSNTTPKSGKIFLIQHPDGLRIKRLRREIDGTWVLQSDNPDKRRFPDESIEPEHAQLLKIVGSFVYRQGG
ncbi:MAG: S24 family peptidase [Dokdonella sp.]|uniref:S24 family peptidase n=1 Tax=Dokdonella sp. TaxID=2291710 RepID=UPI003F81C859